MCMCCCCCFCVCVCVCVCVCFLCVCACACACMVLFICVFECFLFSFCGGGGGEVSEELSTQPINLRLIIQTSRPCISITVTDLDVRFGPKNILYNDGHGFWVDQKLL